MQINNQSLSFLWERPITLVILIITVLIVLGPLFGWFKERRRNTVTSGEGG